jgi:uncharacterized DUF497 family protein
MPVDFEWDEAKSARCRAERGFSFADVIPTFADPGRVVEDDLRFEYGEPRFRLYGRIKGRLFVIAFTVRNGVHRIISARKANAREIRRHGKGQIEK